MTQISRSYHGDVPGSTSEELKTNFDLHLTLFFDALKNTNNSMDLIDPSVLESLSKKTRVALNQINWETVSNESKPRKGPTKTTKTTKTKKRTTLDFKNVEAETTLTSKKTIVNLKRESMPISTSEEQKLNANKAEVFLNYNTVDDKQRQITDYSSIEITSESNSETVNDGLKSMKEPTNITEMAKINKHTTLDTKNVEDETALNNKKDDKLAAFELEESIGKHTYESKCEANLNKAQSIKHLFDNQEDLLGNEKSLTSTKSSNESNRKPGRKKLKSKKDPTCETESTLEPNDVSAESTSSTNENEGKTSAYRKKKEIEAARRDFPIENVDWYYKDKIKYKKECRDTLSCFITDGYDKAYTYLLFDPRIFKDVSNISWLDFINAIFYIGKGIDMRAYEHMKTTEKWLKNGKPPCLKGKKKERKKFLKIEAIWKSRNPIKLFKITKNITEYEGYTREAAMIDAMGLGRLCNEQRGTYYKKAKLLEAKKCLELGASLLVEAWDIFKGKDADVEDVKPKKKEIFDLFFG